MKRMMKIMKRENGFVTKNWCGVEDEDGEDDGGDDEDGYELTLRR